MKNIMHKARNLFKKGAIVSASAVAFVGGAHAELPAAATTAMTSISTGISDAEAAAWPLIGAALVAGIIIKLVKRFSNKV